MEYKGKNGSPTPTPTTEGELQLDTENFSVIICYTETEYCPLQSILVLSSCTLPPSNLSLTSSLISQSSTPHFAGPFNSLSSSPLHLVVRFHNRLPVTSGICQLPVILPTPLSLQLCLYQSSSCILLGTPLLCLCLSLNSSGSIKLLSPSGSTLVICRSSFTTVFWIPGSASIVRAISSALALGTINVALTL